MSRRGLFAKKLSWAGWLGVMALAACGGCWEEIEYTGPAPATATRHAADSTAKVQSTVAEPPARVPLAVEATTSVVEAEAANFGEDLAESLPDPAADVSPRPQSSADPDSLPTTDENAAPRLPSHEDPYAIPAAETSANYASADSYTRSNFAPAESTLPDTAADEPAVDEPAAQVPAEHASNSELAAWQLGSKLSLAALAHDRGVAAQSVQQWLADCELLATTLGTAAADLPEPAAAQDGRAASRVVLTYLLSQGQRIGRDLARQHGARHPALFEVAMKSNLLRVLYEPGSAATQKLAASIADAAQRAHLPAELWQPLLDTIASTAQVANVRKAVQRMHADIERHLAEKVER